MIERLGALDGARARRDLGEFLRQGNVDYASEGTTWASHENYLCWMSPLELRPRLMPHLVSRIVFTGGGGFDPFDTSRPRFVLSPRLLFMRQGVAEVCGGRGLVDPKNEPLCAGFHRQHLICGDSLRGHLGTFLRLGTTALVIGLVEARCEGDPDVKLASPLAALSTITRDVSLGKRLRLANGRYATALAIQRHYLLRARRNLEVLPDWASAVCDVWQETLDRLLSGVDAVADRLDWAIKFTVYRNRATRRGMSWPSRRSVMTGLAPRGAARAATTGWRAELCELDTRFGQLYPPGLFDALDEAGVLQHRVPGVIDVDRAVTCPPAQGRAFVRGTVITRLAAAGDAWICAWDGISDLLSMAHLDLSHPFVEQEQWSGCLDDPRITLARRIVSLARSHDAASTGPSIRECAESLCEPSARVLRRHMAHFAVDLNDSGVGRRGEGRLEDAEWLIRTALAINIDVLTDTSPLIPHRRCNLATVLLLQGRLDEALEQLELAWQAIGSQYNVTTARILTVRLAVALLRGEAPEFFVGQLKSHLAIHLLRPFPRHETRSATGQVFERLGARFSDADLALLMQIMAVLNTDQPVESLDEHPRWQEAEAVPLAAPWPATQAFLDVLPW
jgi:hypothetical protein